jgi:Protein of unknown function (DUF3570)
VQLTKNRGRDLGSRLLASSCALLATATAKADTGDVNYDFDLLYYAESGRVKAIEPTVVLTRNLGSESSLSARIVVDSLTGATPTGEMPSSRGNSVTGASGSVSSAAGELPQAPFQDRRGARERNLVEAHGQPVAPECWRQFLRRAGLSFLGRQRSARARFQPAQHDPVVRRFL